MKRFTAFLLMLLLVLTLCSCGKRHVQEEPVPPDVQEHIGGEQQPVDPAPDTTEPVVVPEEPITPANPPAKPDKQEEPPEEPYYHGGSTTKNLTITEGKTVTGGTYQNVTIAESVGNGTVTLENVTIDGQLIIRGGGSNSVKVKNSKVKEVKLDKDTSGANAQEPRLELTGTEVKTVEVAKPAIIEATDTASAVHELSAKDDVTIKGEATKVETVTVLEPETDKENVKLTVNDAAVTTVMAEAPVVIETNAAMDKTPVAAVEAKANVTVTGAATNVGTVTVDTGSNNGVTLTVTDAKVKNVSAVTPVTIEANAAAAKIEKVEAKADVTVNGDDTKINTITVPDDLEEGKVPEITVTAGSVNTVKADGKAKVSGTAANAIANVEAAAPVTVDSAAVAKVTVVSVKVSVTVNGDSTGNSTVEVAVEVETSGSETVAIEAVNATVNVSTTQENAPTVKVNNETVTHIHKWVKTGRTEATCTGTGSITYTCNEPDCTENTKTETIPAKGHTEVVIPAVEPTCTAGGKTAGKVCADCGAELVTQTDVDPLGHSYGKWVSDETGHWKVCARCGEIAQKAVHTYNTNVCTVAAKCTGCGYQKAAGTHTWDAGKAQKTATCETAGSVLYTCTSCGDTKTETIPALGHTYGAPVFNWNDTGTNCTAERACTRNGCNHTDSAVAQVSSYELKNPTCTEPGVTVYTATVVFDGKTYSATTNATVNATGHTGVKQNGQAATCEAAGWNDYYKCSKCQKLFSGADCNNEITNLGVWKTGDGKLAALGHAYGTPSYEWKGDSCTATRACTREGCNHKETETVTAATAVTQEKTCILDELSTYTATFTNSAFEAQTQTNVKTADKLGHSLTKTEAEAATCEKAGNRAYWSCSRCNKYFSNDQGTTEIETNSWVIKATGHSFTADWTHDATYHWHAATCEHTTEVSGKATHSWNSGVVTTQPTCTEKGVKTYTCTVCSATKTETIAALGHKLTAHEAVAATCTAAGNSAYWTCDTCSKVFSDENGTTETTVAAQTIPTLDHKGEKQNGQAATCTADGWKDYYQCSVCHKLFSDESCKNEITLDAWKTGGGKVAALGHAYGTTPTWNWTGYTSAKATFTCTRSGCTHMEEMTATGAAITNAVTTSAGCDSTGTHTYTATVTFGGNNYTDTKTETLAVLGHTGVKQNGQAATCEADGWQDYYKCSKCQKLFSDAACKSEITDLAAWETGGGKVAALGHAYGTPSYEWNGNQCTAKHVCTRSNCTHEETETVTAATAVTQNKTCTLNELSTYTATFTNSAFEAQTQTNVKTADKLGHQLTKTEAKDATCTAAGNNEYWTCSQCDKYFSNDQGTTEIETNSWVIKATGHSFSTDWAHDATDHWHAATCEHTTEVSGKATHSWNSGVVTTQPTCTEKGVKTFTCSVCGATRTEDVAVVAHTSVKQNGQAATCTADGWKDYYECSVCHKYFSDADCKNEITNLSVWKSGDGKRDALGHAYGTTPVWNWAEDHTTATATFACTRDSSHTVSVTASNTDITHKDVTNYSTEGTRTYTAKVVFGDKTYQNTATKALPATPFKVGENTYATYEDALDAAHKAGLKEEKLFDLTYKVYPTIEVYGSCTLDSLDLAVGESIAVMKDGSLTVNGALTLATSTIDYWMFDAGVVTVENGGSFKWGDVQYTGADAVFGMDNDKSYIALTGCPRDAGSGIFFLLNGDATLNADKSFATDRINNMIAQSKLTVAGTLINKNQLENRGAILIDGGTLTNKNTIDNESGIIPDAVGGINIKNKGTLTNEASGKITGGNIDAFGSTVNNAGTIRIGDGCALIIENDSTLTNEAGASITGGQGSEINIGDYIYAGETATVTNTVTGIDNNEAVTVPVMKAAAVFDLDQLQDALNTYDYVIPCGTETTGTNTVTLGNLTIPAGKLLILKETVNDGTNQYHNKFVLGKIEIQRDPAEKDPHNGNLVTVGNPDVTVNGRIDARGFIAFDTLTIANGGYVYVENEMMIVDKALTVAEGGTLEIGSGSQMYYRGENNATINGTLIKTIRNMNGFVNQVCSDIQGKGMTPNATLTTLVITENTILHDEHTVDTVIPIRYTNDKGETVAPTLRVGANSSLKFKTLYTGEGGTADQIIGCSENMGEDGYYTVSPNASSAVEVASATDFLAALDDPTVTDITITEDITLTYADNLWNHPITKAVTVAKTATLEIKPYDPETNSNMEEPGGMKFNGLMIADNGSLTLEKGWLDLKHATLKTDTYRSGENEPWYEYRSQVNVNGGVLDASQGKLETDSTGNIDFEVGNGELKLPGTVKNYLITYTVDSKEELLSANGANDPCNNILLVSDVELTEDYTVNKALTVMNDEWRMYRLTVSSGTTLTVPENKIFYVNGEVRVEGTLVNNGTIVGEGFIDVMGGTLNNGGKIDLNGDIGVERGATLQNYVGETKGTITQNASITFADYWYPNGNKEYYQWNALDSDTTLETLGNNVAVMAVAFSPEQVQAALGDTKYDMVMACGENEESTVVLDNITVPDGKTLMLKDYVDVGERTIHNTYDLSNITFEEDAYLLIMGSPVINVDDSMAFDHVSLRGEPIIHAPGFVSDADELKTALAEGGDVYLNPFAMEDRHKEEFTFEDGHTETVYETQYRIDENFTISNDVNLINVSGSTMAVFFDGGFTVAEGKTLKFNGLNVVAAADSSVNGRVEAYNGILVVQGENGGATLTISNTGTVVIGSEEVWGRFAIFDESKPNKIINRGTIESYGDLIFDRDKNCNPRQFEGNDPIEYATFRDLVCDLNREFGNMPNMKQIDFEEENEFGPVDLHWLYDYTEEGQELERNKDYDAIGAFAWLIKNDIIPECSEQNPKLNPWHHMTCDEVGDLFNKFATKVLGTATNLDIATGTDLADKNPCFGKLREALKSLSSVNAATEEDFLYALDTPYITSIYVTGDITLNGCYYKDGQRVGADVEFDDGNACYLWGAGEWRDQWREIIVEPGVTLTVASGVKVDIQQGVELRLRDENGSNGKLVLEKGSGLNVFGGLKPDSWGDEEGKYVIQDEGSYINFFPDVMEFTKRLGERMRDRIATATDEDIVGYTNLANDWPDRDDRVAYFAALVKCGALQPRTEGEGNDFRMVWRPYDKVQYNEAMNILDNLWKGLFDDETMPDGIRLNDVGRPDEWLDDDRVDRLIDLFKKSVQAKDSGAVMVDSIEALTAALPNGGDIYLLPFAKENRQEEVFTFENGYKETVYETQYRITAKTTIATYTNLIKLGGDDPMAVFFDGGFTVNENVKLQFHGLNVVAAADSSVNGRVEAYNGILVVQANSNNGATLTNNGTITIHEDGKLAIFPKGYENNKIVNNGTIESFGELKFDLDQSKGQFEGNQPIVPKEEISGDVTLTIQRKNDNDKKIIIIAEGQESREIIGDTIENVQFNGPVTIVCDTSQLSGDNFGGDILFRNCEFKEGVTVQLAAGIGYNIRLEGCTGNFTATATDMSAGGNVSFFGSNLTVNGLTITNMPGWESDDGINVRYDKCGDEENKTYISTVEVMNRQGDKTVSISGSNYSGKLRVAGKLDISGVILSDGGRIELCNEPGEANIALGGNRITVNDDCGGEYHFTGAGEVYVPGGNSNANIKVNDVFLGAPHIFGNDNYGIFIPVGSNTDIEVTVKEGEIEPFSFDVQYKEDGGGRNLIQHDANAWIENPNDVCLTIKVEDGCTVVYENLHYSG